MASLLKAVYRNKFKYTNGWRALSSAVQNELTTIAVNEKSGIAILTMNRPPVNSLNLDLLSSIQKSINLIESNKCRGCILTSANKTVFCAGLDIMEMFQPDQDRLRQFWTALQDMWLTLYGSNVSTAAALNGHSPAGGCLLATSCEYRVMLRNFTIGLNETQLGIVAPKWFMAAYTNVLSQRIAELALTQGKLFSSEEALKVGLVDDLVSNKEEAMNKCEEFFSTFSKANPFARAATKQQFRSKVIEQLKNEKSQDLEAFISFVTQPSVQKNLGLYIENLKQKRIN